MNHYHAFIPGRPQPKGSTRSLAFRRENNTLGTRTFSANKSLDAWNKGAVDACIAARPMECPITAPLFDGAVMVHAEFTMPRPSTAPKTAKGKPLGPHVKKPDIDKLCRALCDVLKRACIIEDDAKVVALVSSKSYAGIGIPPGVDVTVTPIVGAGLCDA